MGSTSVPPPDALVEGQTLAGKYQLVRRLGAGGMCLVFEAEHVHLKQAVALKVLKPELARDPDSVARFSREAQAAAKLRSANVARVHDVDRLTDGQPYITMELLVGHDLGTELARRGALPVPLAVDYVRQACAGIAEAHALGIIHRDLKPENLFLTELGEMTDRKLLKILDFGIAKNLSESQRRLTAPDAVFGTVDYMSPEQIRSASTVDARTDIWSLGVILYELLTGRLPFTGDARAVIAQIASDPVPPPSRFAPALPPSLVAIVMKALSKDTATRWQSAEELRHALEPFSDIEPITGVLARLPPQSVPRRAADTPLRPLTPIEESNVREMRTNVTWVETPAPKGGGRWWLAAALVVVVAGGGTAGYLARDLLSERWSAMRGDGAASRPAPQAAAPPPVAPAPPLPTATATDEPAAAPTADEEPAAPVVSVATARRAKPTAPRTRTTPRSTSSSTPPPSPRPSLPKHL